MPQITESTMVGAPVGEVWTLLRDFAAIGDWHPALPSAEIEDGPPTALAACVSSRRPAVTGRP